MTGRDLSSPVTVINRFTVKGDPEDFERQFRQHSQHLRRQRGFAFLVTVRLLERQDVYVHLVRWRRLESFLNVVHDDTFLAHVQRLGKLVDTEADQAVAVARITVENALVGADNVVLLYAAVDGDHLAFQEDFVALGEDCRLLGGFGGSDLLHSIVSPQRYLGLMWWRDTESCDRALAGSGFRDWRQRMLGRARIRVERTRHVAYERVLTE
ncbi:MULTISPECIES: antibiotic biosynthesis monooxygenase [Streptomyces]|uniref:ABM domain-containing protein n=1 Tax=Streptomyces lycii TaxID=2654337 RepID=A0ABQ7FFZ4_9ACTN|nr:MULTISPECIES: antibiotic biosynthesis monooxygenase [Streptomyces]KAF4407921.1 hypothetical protein GCU69_17030 [Streptomyces lycii]PGH50238.1 hypothetical protein CRI70_13250 [Streptomyces sp. Ru87]